MRRSASYRTTNAITYIDLVDDLLMSSPDPTEDICQAIIDSGLKFKWSCNGRLNWVTSDVIKMMKRAGCVFINYGIESVDDETMKNMKKGLTLAMVIKGVEITREEGMSAGLNMIFGNIGDNLDTLRRAVEFLCQYDEGKQKRTIRPVTPYPGSPLYFTAIERGLLKDTKEFYEVKHLNSDLLAVNFTDLTDKGISRRAARSQHLPARGLSREAAQDGGRPGDPSLQGPRYGLPWLPHHVRSTSRRQRGGKMRR